MTTEEIIATVLGSVGGAGGLFAILGKLLSIILERRRENKSTREIANEVLAEIASLTSKKVNKNSKSKKNLKK